MKKMLGISVSLTLIIGSLAGAAQAKKTGAPANDDSAAAVVVEGLPFSDTVNVKGSTLEPDEARPSCSRIQGSVWYALGVPEDGTVMGDVSSTFPAAMAVYEQTPEGGLLEVACAAGQAGSSLEFEGSPAKLYLVQLSATGQRRGIADISLHLSTWKSVTLVDQTFERKVDEQKVPLLKVHGRPRPGDPSMYDVTVTVAQRQQSFGILTYGLVTQEVREELAHVPAIATRIQLQVTARYDSSQYRCAIDDGAGTCYAGVPLRDLGWLTGGDGSRAELVVKISVEKNDRVLLERSQAVPYAGQVIGLLP